MPHTLHRQGSPYLDRKVNYLNAILGRKLVLDLNADFGITIATGVSIWKDQSGRANHTGQATGGTQPTRALSVLDGHAAVQFNGSQFLEALTFNGIAAGDFPRTYVVGSWAGSTSYTGCLVSLAASSALNSGTYITHSANQLTGAAKRGAVAVGTANATSLVGQSSVPALFDVRNDPTNLVISQNNADAATIAADPAGLTSTINRYYLGVLENKATHLLTGQILRCFVVNPAPTANQHNEIIAYLKRVYPSLGL